VTHINDATVGTVIDRIVLQAHLPGAAAREDLRRELQSHFDEVGTSPEALNDALTRFGSVSDVARTLRSVYRWDFIFLHAARLLCAVVVSVALAESLLALANLRIAPDAGLRLLPRFFEVYSLGIKVVFAMAAAWEIGRTPFDLRRASVVFVGYWMVMAALQAALFGTLRGWIPWNIPALIAIGFLTSRVDPAPLRLPLMFGGFLAYLLATTSPGVASRPLISAQFVITWILTEALFSRADRVFGAWFNVSMDTSFRSAALSRPRRG
jgi:hypothetical protein